MFRVLIIVFLLALAPLRASADEDEWVWDIGLGPRVQFLSEDRPTGFFTSRVLDWPSPYLGLRYGLTDFAHYGAWEVGFGGSYAAEADAIYRDVEWEPRIVGDVLENFESWNVALETRIKYGVMWIPYLTAGVGWHKLVLYNIDFLTPGGKRIRHYSSQLREVPYASVGAGFEWRFANKWSTSLDGSLQIDIGEDTNQYAVPIRLKFSYYMQD